MTDKMNDDASGKPSKVKDDPYAELFADCNTAEDVLQLQREIDAMEAAEKRKRDAQ